jgi:hypothetical protein
MIVVCMGTENSSLIGISANKLIVWGVQLAQMELSVSFVPNVMKNCKGKFEKQAWDRKEKMFDKKKGRGCI